MMSSPLRVLSLSLLAALIMAGNANVSAEGVDQLREPVFGLAYDGPGNYFDEAPNAIRQACTQLFNERWDRRLWLYGSASSDGASYYVIGGQFVRRPEQASGSSDEGSVLQDVAGAVVVLRGKDCTLVGPAREVLEVDTDEVTPEVMAALSRDVVRRLAGAFGGVDDLEREMRQQGIDFPVTPESSLGVALRNAREASER
jgi:hypothetical protein